jgi:hypothetical protein
MSIVKACGFFGVFVESHPKEPLLTFVDEGGFLNFLRLDI